MLVSWRSCDARLHPSQPGQPIATATVRMQAELTSDLWDASAGATFYSVGWAEEEGIRQMLGVGREWTRRISLRMLIPAAYTS